MATTLEALLANGTLERAGVTLSQQAMQAIDGYNLAVAKAEADPDLNDAAKVRRIEDARRAAVMALEADRARHVQAVEASTANEIGQAVAAVRGVTNEQAPAYETDTERAARLAREVRGLADLIRLSTDVALLRESDDPAEIGDAVEAAVISDKPDVIARIGRVAQRRLSRLMQDARASSDAAREARTRDVAARVESALRAWEQAHPSPLARVREARAKRDRLIADAHRGIDFAVQFLK